jgi:two-component system NarL family response regulator
MTPKKRTARKLEGSVKRQKKPFPRTPKIRATKKRSISILIADDHSVVCEGLVSLIRRESDMTVVGEAANGREAIDLWRKHRPDVILLDLRMPKLDGLGVIKQIRQEDENGRIVVLTSFDGDEDIYRAIRGGAKGYLLKDAPREALMDCIRRVNAGETCVPVPLVTKLVQRAGAKTLSERQTDVLKLMAQGRRNRDIGTTLSIGERTVKSHVEAILSKMNVISRTEAVAHAMRSGLINLN